MYFLFVQVSRAQILKKAADYISFMRRKNHGHQQDIDDLKKHNVVLEQQSKLQLDSRVQARGHWGELVAQGLNFAPNRRRLPIT